MFYCLMFSSQYHHNNNNNIIIVLQFINDFIGSLGTPIAMNINIRMKVASK